MADSLRLMAVLAHPDDESMGLGSVLARYAAEGVEVTLVTATRGEYGWAGDPATMPDPTALGQLREGELRGAVKALGIKRLILLDYIDGHVDEADAAEAIGKIVDAIREVRPQVVITFDQAGIYGHPDHIAVGQFTAAALVCAADSDYGRSQNNPPHRVSKFYVNGVPKGMGNQYQEYFGEIVMMIDGVERRMVEWESWAFTTEIDGSGYLQQVKNAILCHQSQLPDELKSSGLPDEVVRNLWSDNPFYRVYSLVNGGRALEHDLFEGLR
jgi:LmbE family N-acetylglucosaminyl deacetylase